MLSTYKLTSSQLVSLLQILGALVADYKDNPTKPVSKELRPLLKSALRWKELPGLEDAVKSATTGNDKLSALYELGTQLKSAFPTFHKNKEYTTPELQLLKAIRTYLMTDSEPALRYIVKNASIFGAPELAKAFMPAQPKADTNSLKKIVKALVGRDSVYITPAEAAALEETDPDGIQHYKELRKEHNTTFKTLLMNYVRAAGAKAVPYADVFRFAQDQGFIHSLVPGFDGMIDDQGKWYTKDGKLINGVPNLVTYSNVVMNPKPSEDAPWIFKAVKHDGDVAYAYTADFKRAQSKAKYEKVRVLMAKIPAIRKKWLAEVKAFDITNPTSVAAVVLEILYSFAARIGSAPGRGAGTLQVKNARPTQQGINLAYLGKDSIPTRHILKESDPIHKQLLSAINAMLEHKQSKDYLFTYWSGSRWKVVTPSMVNNAFRSFGAPEGLSVHKLRTSRGSALFRELMEQDAQRRPPKDDKEALARFKKMTEEVGKLLNHKRGVGGAEEKVTGTTASQSYIDGDMQVLLWDNWNMRMPPALERLMRSEDS